MCNTNQYYASLNNLSSDSLADIYNNITDTLFFKNKQLFSSSCLKSNVIFLLMQTNKIQTGAIIKFLRSNPLYM